MSKSIIAALFLIAALLGGGYWFFMMRSPGLSGYQAVFLSNGQVYFGRLAKANNAYPELTDIYYLVMKRPLQSAAGSEAAEGDVTPAGQETSKPEYTLIKLGGEMHGPKDRMQINRRHILFVENLQDESKVVRAINTSKEQEQ